MEIPLLVLVGLAVTQQVCGQWSLAVCSMSMLAILVSPAALARQQVVGTGAEVVMHPALASPVMVGVARPTFAQRRVTGTIQLA